MKHQDSKKKDPKLLDSLKYDSLPEAPSIEAEPKRVNKTKEDLKLDKDIARSDADAKIVNARMRSAKSGDLNRSEDPIQVDGIVRDKPSESPVEKPKKEEDLEPDSEFSTNLLDSLQKGASAVGSGISEVAESVGTAVNNGVEKISGITDEYPNFWLGAAPLLMGALLGDVGEGARAGSDALFNQVDMDFKREIASKKKKAKADEVSKRGTFQLKPYERADGSIGYLTVDTRTGESLPTDITAGYKRSITKNPLTGELSSISGASDSAREVFPSGNRYTMTQKKEISDMRDDLLKDKIFLKNRETVSSTGRALALLAAGNPIADAGIKTIFPRMFGEVGNLAAAEQERFSGSPAFTRKFESLKDKFMKGTLTKDDRADLVEVAQVMKEYSVRQLELSAKAYIASNKNLTGYSSQDVINPFLGGREIVPTPDNVPVAVRTREAKKAENIGEPVIYYQNGWAYKKTKTGGFEAIGKDDRGTK